MPNTPSTTAAAALAGLLLCGASQAQAGYSAAAVPFAFADISATGTLLPGSTGDDIFASVALPFNFQFYGTLYGAIFVSSNGLLTFDSGNSTFTNADLTTSPAQAAIAPFWDDLLTDTGGSIYTQTFGAPGSRTFVIQWDQVDFFSGGDTNDPLTFQAMLSEGSNNIRFNYQDLVSGIAGGNNGGSATVGIKDTGVQGPDRLLLAFNNGPNAFVGGAQSTLITFTPDNTVPEPATLALLGFGLAGLGIARRRRARG